MKQGNVPGASVDQDSRQVTVINVSVDPEKINPADEYIVVVNNVQVARWHGRGRQAQRAGLRGPNERESY